MASGNKGGFVPLDVMSWALRAGRMCARVVDPRHSRRTVVVMLLWFFLVSSAWIVNLNSRGVNRPHVDE